MLDVYDFLSTFSDLSAVVISIFDCSSEEVVWCSAGKNLDTDKIVAIELAGLDGYEVQGADLFKNSEGLIQMEINIDMGDEED